MQQTYKIGEAAALLNLKTYVLRFWETEFSQISPIRTEKGQRLYTRNDLELLRKIRFLLHERGLTIEGAKRILEEQGYGTPQALDKLEADDIVLQSLSSLATLDEEGIAGDTSFQADTAAALAGFVSKKEAETPHIPAKKEEGAAPCPASSSLDFLQDIINELDEVAAILRNGHVSGNQQE